MGLKLLEGVRVLDFTQALSGPYATLMLADLGADIIKVENPARGDDARHWGPPFFGVDAAYFAAVNRNKRSVSLNLKVDRDVATVLRLVDQADVVIENWRPGTAQRLGLGAAQLRDRRPALIYCSISGFGQDQGPRSGYDQILQGTSGVMSLTGRLGEPTKWGVPVGDVASGMFAASAILAALYERERTGIGRTVDIAMQDCLVSMLTHHAARYLTTGTTPQSEHNGHATIAPYGMFKVCDGFVNICVGNDSQFQRACIALGRPDLAADLRFKTNPLRLANKATLLAELDVTLASRSVSDTLAALEAVGVPAGPVAEIGEVLNQQSTADRSMVVTFERSDSGVGQAVNTPFKFDGMAPTARLPPPRLGEHNHELTPVKEEAAGDGAPV